MAPTEGCKTKDWHPTTDCVNSTEREARWLQKLKSDLFQSRGYDIPTPQKDIMNRNYSASTFLRLPPEIRLRIYGFVFGGQQLWIGHSGVKLEWLTHDSALRQHEENRAHLGQHGVWFHRFGRFTHRTADQFNSADPWDHEIHLVLLRVCRQIYTESAMLPYALNTFTFSDSHVRKLFEQSARAGNKVAQKKAVGKFEIGDWLVFHDRHSTCVESIV